MTVCLHILPLNICYSFNENRYWEVYMKDAQSTDCMLYRSRIKTQINLKITNKIQEL
jgi:hypothetical protein